VIATAPVGTAPHGVATDGVFVYVTNEISNTISIIDTRTNTVVDTVEGVALLREGIAMIYSSGTSGTAPPSPGAYPCRSLGG
jgi:YVTN family beta-propeller protein